MKNKLLSLILTTTLIITSCGSNTHKVDLEAETESSRPSQEQIDEQAGNISDKTEENSQEISPALFDKEVSIVYSMFSFDDTTIDEYVETYKAEHPDYIDVQVYDDDHFTVTMLESERKELLEKANETLDEYMTDALYTESFNYAFTNMEYDNLLTDIKLYADKDKVSDPGFNVYGVVIVAYMMSDTLQAMNMIDPENRDCVITIFDNESNEMLYSSEENSGN